MLRFGPLLALFAWLTVSPSVLLAQLSDLDRSRLAQAIESAGEQIDADLFPRPEDAKQDLLAQVLAVRHYFETHADSDNREAWFQYLRMDPLVHAIEANESVSAMGKEARSLHNRLVGMAPGLELSSLRRLRGACERLSAASRFHDHDRSKAYIVQQLQTLGERLAAMDEIPSPEDFAAISLSLGTIESSGQASNVVHAFQDTFARPNVSIQVGQPLVQKAIGRGVTRERPVRDCILGTRIIGSATLNGMVTASLLPSVGSAKVHLNFNAQVMTRNIGYNGPVRLHTTGNGDVNITRTMSIDAGGTTFGPTVTDITLQTRVNRIQHKLALVRRIARKSVTRQKPRADRIAQERMRVQVESQFVEETSKVSPVTPTDLLTRADPTLKRLSLARPTQIWSSTKQAIAIDSVYRGDAQLSSVVPRPAIRDAFDAAIQIHESAIENALSTVLAGRTLNEKRVNELLEKLGREPANNNSGDTEQSFEIAFSRSRPIIFEAREQTLRIGVRGTRFVKDNRVLQQLMEITATYVPVTGDDGVVVLRRQGNVIVNFPSRKHLGIGQAGIRPLIERTFTKLFPEVMLDRVLKIPDDARVEALRGLEYRVRWVDAQDGWLTIAIR